MMELIILSFCRISFRLLKTVLVIEPSLCDSLNLQVADGVKSWNFVFWRNGARLGSKTSIRFKDSMRRRIHPAFCHHASTLLVQAWFLKTLFSWREPCKAVQEFTHFCLAKWLETKANRRKRKFNRFTSPNLRSDDSKNSSGNFFRDSDHKFNPSTACLTHWLTSKSWTVQQNLKVWPLKWKLSTSTF